jgi:diguanylate cyclase (GGDEF)-like protein
MSRRAWQYLVAVFAGAGVLSVLAALTSPIRSSEWLPLTGLTLLAVLAQLFKTETPGRQSYYPNIVFFFAGVLLLPPSLFVVLVAVPHLVEWGKERVMHGPYLREWYIQPFNISAHVISGFVAYWAYSIIGSDPISSYSPRSVVGVVIALALYVLLNHLLVGLALMLARDLSWKQSGILEIDSLLPDLVLSCLGYVVAVLVGLSPWVALPALAPLALVHRVFLLFKLKHDSYTDSKTGLWNSRHFNTILNAEMERAKRFSRHLSLVVVEIDDAKGFANSYGYLAMDRVIGMMGKLLRDGTRQYDVCARLEGSTFAILLPETNPFEALIVARRLRTTIKESGFAVETVQGPLHVTASMGVSCFPGDAIDTARLVECAQVAAHYAASRGRSTIACAPDVPAQIIEAKGPLSLKGEIYMPSSEAVQGFANPALRNPQSSNF